MSNLKDIKDMAVLIEEARKLGPMTDEQRREQAASFAFGQIALTSDWRDKTAPELDRLRKTCRQMVGLGQREDDRQKGLDLDKYKVERADGSTREGGKHADCKYFVLDLRHDKFAGNALEAYAQACKEEYPRLSLELREVAQVILVKNIQVEKIERTERSARCPSCYGTGIRAHEGSLGGTIRCECGARPTPPGYCTNCRVKL
jgi:hypothetical protein